MNVFRRIAALFNRSRMDRDMDLELRSHLERETEQNVTRGLSPDEARFAARRAFGGVEQIKERERDVRGILWLENLWRDARFAARSLGKSPVFTSVAILSLALGIGANTAIYSVLQAVLLRAMPVRESQELRLINWMGRNPHYSGYNGPGTRNTPGGFTVGTSFSYPAYCALRDHGTGFTDIFAYSSTKSVIVVAEDGATKSVAMLVSGNYFSGYGAEPAIGRSIVSADNQPDAAPVAVITHRWWAAHCGSDPSVIGRTLTINNTRFTVIGVLPPSYRSPVPGDPADFYVPLSLQPQVWPTQPIDSPDRWWVQIMGRLAPGADEAQAQAELSVIFRQALNLSRTRMEDGGILLEDGSRGQLMLRRNLARPYVTLTVVGGVVLLIACANLAGLLLARGAAREHAMAVRAAMGAGRWRLIRQSLAESLLLALLGAALGLAVSLWSRPLLLGFLALNPESWSFDLRLDSTVLGFTLGVTVFTALLFGLLPALRTGRVDPSSALKSRSTTGAPRLNFGKTLVVVQVALSVLLVVGAGLMIRTFTNLTRIEPGFDPENLLLFRLKPGDAGYQDERLFDVYDRVRSAVAAIPGVQAVTYSSFPLVSGSSSSGFVEFSGRDRTSEDRLLIKYLEVDDDFLASLNIPLLRGRGFNAADTATSPAVVIVNETFIRHFFPGEDPLGQTFTLEHPTRRVVQIIGVAKDAMYRRVRDAIPPLMYLAQRQHASDGAHFAVRSAVPPFSLLPAVRQAVATVDPNLPLSTIRTQADVLDQSVAQDRTFATFGGALAFLAVLLSCIGLYGLMAYNVARRSSEFGIRMALGARPNDVARPVVREALLLVATGLVIGVPAALMLVRFVESRLYGVTATDPLTFAGGALLFFAVAVLAAWLPARRAAKVDPVIALRAE